ncbi:MAG: cation:proton antiporter [Bacteroidaceae bacterium]|nr:cation:proton antiporter [Bacteroidaceae bacterium]
MMPIDSIFPITDPTWIFFLVLCIILFAPILLNRLHIPHIVGMLLAGVLIGPHGLDLLQRDSSFEIFGNVGLLYIMFLAGVEIDLADFNKNKNKSVVFGLTTFLFPFIIGALVCHYLLQMEWAGSLLIASMFSSHTLVSYAIVSRYGLSHNRSINMAVGGTIITDTISLIVLAIISQLAHGNNNSHFWIVMAVSVIVFITGVIYLFPRVARFFFRTFEDPVQQFIFVMAMMFLAAIGANAAGLEGLLGAFFAGIVLNRLIPSGSPLMGRIEFVGNAIFIPYFLIGVGMLIDVSVFIKGIDAIIVATVMVVGGTLGKFIAAWIPQKIFGLHKDEGLMLFGLSESHAAGTLAMVMVGYELGLFNENVLNATLVFILMTCIISSLATEKASRQLVLNDELSTSPLDKGDDEKILIPMVANQNVENLMQVAMMMRNPKLNRGLIGLNVVYDNSSQKEIEDGRKCLQRAEKIATSADVRMQTQSRLATNLSNGIVHALRENDASELILGMHKREIGNDNSFFGPVTLGLLAGTSRQIILVRPTMPINTLRRIHVVIPAKAEYEAGFYRWVNRLSRMAGILGCRIIFHAHSRTWNILSSYLNSYSPKIRAEYVPSIGQNELKRMSSEVNDDHLLVVVSARKGSISYRPAFEHIPELIDEYHPQVSLMMIFPDEYAEDTDIPTLYTPHATTNYKGYETHKGWLSELMEKWRSKA